MSTIPRSITQERVGFTDTSAFFALASPRDKQNLAAKAILRRLQSERWRLITTNFVRAETHALILNRVGHSLADAFLRGLRRSPATTIIRVTEQDEEAALQLIAQYADKDFSLTDATSFVVMEHLGITHAFAFDDDFKQYGWIVL